MNGEGADGPAGEGRGRAQPRRPRGSTSTAGPCRAEARGGWGPEHREQHPQVSRLVTEERVRAQSPRVALGSRPGVCLHAPAGREGRAEWLQRRPQRARRTQGGSGGWSQVQAGRLAREGAGRLAHGAGGGWGSSARCCWTRGEAGSWRGTWLSCWKCTGGREGGANGQRHWARLGKASLAELAGRCRGRVDRAPGHGALGEPAGPGPEEDQHLSQQGEPIGPRPPSRAWNWSTEAPPAPRTPRT